MSSQTQLLVVEPLHLPRPSVYVNKLSKTYRNGVCALDGVSLEANVGEVVGVVGPNGAGKSTTLKILATLLRPTAGQAEIESIHVGDQSRIRRILGVGLQEAGLDPLMTGYEHFTVQASLYQLKDDKEWQASRDQLIERFDLASYVSRPVGTWSLGTQRRLSTALALLHRPCVVLLDEPTAGLDPRSRRYVWESIKGLRDERKTVIFSSQYLEEADALCDRLYVIDRGRVVASGTPAELKTRIGDKRLILHVDAPPEQVVKVIQNATAHVGELREDTLIFPVKGDIAVTVAAIVGACVTHGVALTDIALADPSLDDVFLEVTGAAVHPEPSVRPRMDMTTRRARGGGSRWR